MTLCVARRSEFVACGWRLYSSICTLTFVATDSESPGGTYETYVPGDAIFCSRGRKASH
jgi:hypothetical protein